MSHYPDADPETRPALQRLRAELPDSVRDTGEHRGDLWIRIDRDDALAVLRLLRKDAATDFDMLVDLCGVDWLGREPRFDVVYHLYSMRHKHRIRVLAGVPEDDPVIESATGIWRGADWFERECYDLVGILFRHHPFLRRLLTHDDFRGHALRKDYDQRQRWRCTRVSDLESTVAVPEAAASQESP